MDYLVLEQYKMGLKHLEENIGYTILEEKEN